MSLLDDARSLQAGMVDVRRAIHRHPEIGFDEEVTSALVTARLTELGLKPEVMAKTGVVAMIGSGGGGAVGLRADMDAVPVPEETGLDFASEVEGASHACGHDSHVAMLLAAAEMIVARKDELERPVKLIFQPAEETVPGGARLMVEEGVLEGVTSVYGIHASPEHRTGELGVCEGPLMAAMDSFTMTVKGAGGHGAMPHQTRDPIHASALVITALQSIASRQVDPLDPVVVSICTVHGGEAFNVIPEEVTLSGTARTLSEELHARLPGEIERIAKSQAKACRCELEFVYNRGTPVLSNTVEQTRALCGGFTSMGGVVRTVRPTMGGEDFAYYLGEVPGCFAFLGVGGDGTSDRGRLHSGNFRLDEDAMPWGAAVLASMALPAG